MLKYIVTAVVLLTAGSPLLIGNSYAREQCGGASWYGPGFHGNRTASGERFNQNAMTAAHRSLPFGTVVRVVDQRTGKSIRVTINDRGPFHGKRIIDLSREAANQLGFRNRGVTSVCIAQL